MERGLLTAEGKKLSKTNKKSLQALWLPRKFAVMHCPGHQTGTDLVAKGNNLADKTAKEPRETTPHSTSPDRPRARHPPSSMLQTRGTAWVTRVEGAHKENGWWHLPTGKVLPPQLMGQHLLYWIHCSTHMGTKRLKDLLQWSSLKIRQSAD